MVEFMVYCRVASIRRRGAPVPAPLPSSLPTPVAVAPTHMLRLATWGAVTRPLPALLGLNLCFK